MRALALLNDLPADFPHPIDLDWIDRGTSKPLRRTTVMQIMRTLYSNHPHSKSILKLHESAGLRIRFGREPERVRFQLIFDRLRRAEIGRRSYGMSAR